MGSVVIITGSSGFMITTILRKLGRTDISAALCRMTPDEVRGSIGNADTVFIYQDTGMDIGLMRPTLLIIQNAVMSNGKNVLIGGTDDMIAVIRRYIPEEYVKGIYPRPMSVHTVVDDIVRLSGNGGGSRQQILLVDDDSVYLNILRDALSVAYDVVPVSSAMQAVTYLSGHRPDLIILDYSMPGISGPDLFRMIKGEPELCSIPITFLTGQSDTESVQKAIELKPDGYILKSVPIENIKQHVRDIFAKQVSP